jgi:hypothetical protein
VVPSSMSVRGDRSVSGDKSVNENRRVRVAGFAASLAVPFGVLYWGGMNGFLD